MSRNKVAKEDRANSNRVEIKNGDFVLRTLRNTEIEDQFRTSEN